MLLTRIQIQGDRDRVDRVAVLDTGFSGGLLMPKTVARAVGARLQEPDRPAVVADGRRLPGLATVVRVRIPEAGVEAVTRAYCPDRFVGEYLVGASFLARVRARLVIGNVRFDFPEEALAENPVELASLDFSRWVVPVRPVNRWW